MSMRLHTDVCMVLFQTLEALQDSSEMLVEGLPAAFLAHIANELSIICANIGMHDVCNVSHNTASDRGFSIIRL
jgi:hypothetical protein